ncbi:4698_t:CDS:1, partial [Acaulospora morrowiae]
HFIPPLLLLLKNKTVSLADDIKKYDTVKLIDLLRGKKDLGLDDDNLEIIRKEKVNGLDFFDLTREELEKHEKHGIKLGPAKRLVKFAKECKEKKLRSFSSYKTKKDLRGGSEAW